jgi:molecular chaperone DnaK
MALSDAGAEPASIQEVIMVGGSSRIPLAQQLVQDLFGKTLNKTFNPDEVVAVGASIQSGILEGNIKSITLLDVTNFSLGIETEGRRFSKIIPKGTHIPTQRTQLVSTVIDNQTTVRIHVLQGEAELAKENVSLGDFELQGIPLGARGSAKVQVKFSIDSNGIVNVSATESGSGLAQEITIKAPTSLSDEDLKQLRNESKKYQIRADTQDDLKDELHTLGQTLTATLNMATSRSERIGAAGMETVQQTIDQFRNQVGDVQSTEAALQLRNIIEKWSADLDVATQ